MASAPPEPPSPGDHGHDRRAQAGHQLDGAGDRLGLAALLRGRVRRGAGRVDEGDDRQPEALGEAEEAHRLAVALGVRHARSCGGCSPRPRRPSGGRRRRRDARRCAQNPPTMAASSPKKRSPCSSMTSVAIRLSSSRVCGRLRLRASWTRAQTASRSAASSTRRGWISGAATHAGESDRRSARSRAARPVTGRFALGGGPRGRRREAPSETSR